MILWIFKLISSVRRAFAGRKHPHQLAWAVAFGLLLGIIPHGNLLALIVLLVVLSLKINHAMAGLTAVATTFLASLLDVQSDRVGQYVLTHPDFRETAAVAWQLPMVPWTDLNNTVVLGSFLIGVAAILPVFAVTYPIFRMLAPKEHDVPRSATTKVTTSAPHLPTHLPTRIDASGAAVASQPGAHQPVAHQVVLIDQGHATVAPPRRPDVVSPASRRSDSSSHRSGNESVAASKGASEAVEFIEVDPSDATSGACVAVETRIDVIRMKDQRAAGSTEVTNQQELKDPQPTDEALNYLLRQLRDSQQRKAA